MPTTRAELERHQKTPPQRAAQPHRPTPGLRPPPRPVLCLAPDESYFRICQHRKPCFRVRREGQLEFPFHNRDRQSAKVALGAAVPRAPTMQRELADLKDRGPHRHRKYPRNHPKAVWHQSSKFDHGSSHRPGSGTSTRQHFPPSRERPLEHFSPGSGARKRNVLSSEALRPRG